jgi:hemolysin activation/secretion protein
MRKLLSTAVIMALPAIGFAQGTAPSAEQPPATASTASYRLPPLSESESRGTTLSAADELFLKEVRIKGATVFDAQALRAATQPYENRMVSSADLQALRLTLTRMYIDRGYVSSGVLLPDQTIVDGVVEFQAVEGTLVDVQLVGEHKISERYVASRVARQVSTPLKIDDMQRALRYLQEDPNVARLDAKLAAGAAPGASMLQLSIDDAPRFSIGLGVDNHRASSTGAERATLYLGARNLTGYGDELRGSVAISEGANESSVAFAMPVAGNGAAVQLYYSLSDADIIEDRFRALDITSETTTWGASLSLPLVEQLNDKFAFQLGAESRQSETRLLDVPFSFSPGAQDGKAETMVGILGFNWLKRGPSYVMGMQVAWRHGFDALDATVFDDSTPEAKLFNTTGADALFDLFQAQGTYLLRLNALPALARVSDRAQVAFRFTAQVSEDPLLSLEKIAIGGVHSVRGYPENLLVRDNGMAASLELQLPILGYRSQPHPLNLVFVPFFDYGRSWDEVDTDPGSDVINTDHASYIYSAGLGLLWNPLRGLEVQAYWGDDLGNNFDGDDPRQFREEDLQSDGFHFAVGYTVRW